MVLVFKSQLIISRDGELNPEYPCGELEFSLFIDLRKNIYELKNFRLNYDIDKCGAEIVTHESIKTNDQSRVNLKPEYVIPATAVSAGIVATPLLLTMLGGKKKRKNKTIKIRKIVKKIKK